MVVASVRAGLRRRHRAADAAEEGVLEEHRLDPELVRLELVEDQLRVVGAVVVADPRVVAADDEVRAAVVLAADRVPDRLARAGVAHRGREGRDEHAVGGVVVLDQHAVALDARRGRDVVALRVADERVDQEAVDGLERALGQVLVRAVDRVAGLEADHALPPALGERRHASRPGPWRAPGRPARPARRRSRARRDRAASGRRAASRRDARRRWCGSSARPRAPCRSRRRPRRRARRRRCRRRRSARPGRRRARGRPRGRPAAPTAGRSPAACLSTTLS